MTRSSPDIVDHEIIQMLLDLLNPLHGELDRQTYDAKIAMDFDMPSDYAHDDISITAQMERDLTQAVLILENRLRAPAQTPSDAAQKSDDYQRGYMDGVEWATRGEPQGAREAMEKARAFIEFELDTRGPDVAGNGLAALNALDAVLSRSSEETADRGDQALGVVRQMVDAYNSGNLQMSSPEIGEPENDIPYHPWHEQLLHYARLALEPSPLSRPHHGGDASEATGN